MVAVLLWRSGWDSNPRAVAGKLISSQPRYDHFDTAAFYCLLCTVLCYYIMLAIKKQAFFKIIYSDICTPNRPMRLGILVKSKAAGHWALLLLVWYRVIVSLRGTAPATHMGAGAAWSVQLRPDSWTAGR